MNFTKFAMTENNGFSKARFCRKFGANPNLADRLLERGVLFYVDDDDCSPLRKKISVASFSNMVETVHYVKCRECGGFQLQITARHLRSSLCDSGLDLDAYRREYPNAPIMSTVAEENKAKSPEQRRAQSQKLKERFKTSAGEITRQKIAKASRRLMQTDYKEKAAEHLRALNRSEERQKILKEQTKNRWSEGGDLRQAVNNWHSENKELSNELAAHARSHIQKKRSNLHMNFKDLMVSKGLSGFVTEYLEGYYHIDEALPDLRLAVEVDGCYWHSCPECALQGPQETLHYDARKESYLENHDWTLLRFWGHQIREEPMACIRQIKNTISQLEKA